MQTDRIVALFRNGRNQALRTYWISTPCRIWFGIPAGRLIAAHALALDLILVSDNVDEFARVPGLSLENWLGG